LEPPKEDPPKDDPPKEEEGFTKEPVREGWEGEESPGKGSRVEEDIGLVGLDGEGVPEAKRGKALEPREGEGEGE
jgi:hypothetical protein